MIPAQAGIQTHGDAHPSRLAARAPQDDDSQQRVTLRCDAGRVRRRLEARGPCKWPLDPRVRGDERWVGGRAKKSGRGEPRPLHSKARAA